MKLKFEETEFVWRVSEDGIDTNVVFYQKIGTILKDTGDLFLYEDGSDILTLDEIEQIYNFIKEKQLK